MILRTTSIQSSMILEYTHNEFLLHFKMQWPTIFKIMRRIRSSPFLEALRVVHIDLGSFFVFFHPAVFLIGGKYSKLRQIERMNPGYQWIRNVFGMQMLKYSRHFTSSNFWTQSTFHRCFVCRGVPLLTSASSFYWCQCFIMKRILSQHVSRPRIPVTKGPEGAV